MSHASAHTDCRPNLFLGSAVALLAVAIYLPYLFGGGLVCDDWAVWSRAFEFPGYWDTVRSWFPLFSNRPAAPLLLAATGNLLGRWIPGYLLLNLAVYGAAIGLTAIVLRRRVGGDAAAVFALLAIAPGISSTLVFSPAMQLLGTSTLLLWALSWLLLDREVSGRGGVGSLIAAHAAVLVGLMIYEVFLPLVAINLLYPWAFGRGGSCTRYAVRYAAPLAAIVLGAALLQTLILPALMPVHSRLSNAEVYPAMRSLAFWAFALLVQLPVLLLDGLRRWRDVLPAGTGIALGAGFGMLWLALRPHDREADGPDERKLPGRLLPATAAALAATSVLYVLSGSYAAVYGYDNRVLASAWWAMALLAAIGVRRFRHRPAVRLAIVALAAVNACSFTIQRNNYLASASLQERIVCTLLATADAQRVPRDAVILADVPGAAPANYNDECVFLRPWDLVNALRYRAPGRLPDVAPVSPPMVRKGRVKVDAGGVTIDGLWRGETERLWCFAYRDDGPSTIVRVRDAEHLQSLVEAVGRRESGPPLSAAARLTERAAAALRPRPPR